MGDSVQAVLAAYRSAGYHHIPESIRPEDHIVTELRFLALLCFDEARAWESDDAALALEYRTRELEFLERHVLRWVPGYCRRVTEEAREDYYRAIALLTEHAVTADRTTLAGLLELPV
jgi:TorA maturation chaperone TorD